LILSLQTTTFGAYGGIPSYNRLVCRAFNETLKNAHVLIAADKETDVVPYRSELPNLEIEAFDRNRFAFTRRFLQLAATQTFDLVLVGHVNYAPLGWLLKRLQPQVRFGVLLYGIEAWTRLPALKKRSLQQADFLIAISDYTKQKACAANGLDTSRINILPNALDWKPDKTGNGHRSTASDGIQLLSVCRLDRSERYKGVDTVIEALPEVLKRVPELSYNVVGGGSDLDRHQALAAQAGVSSRVHFAGSVTDETLRNYYRDCDVFVMPSAGEGFGFVFLEAMKYSKPVIAASSGGAPEVVRDEVTGVLVPPGDKSQLAEAIVRLALDPTKRALLGRNGNESLQENFTFAQFKKGLTNILSRELPHKAAESAYLAPINADSRS
jgi:phosphatidyl-myo-inositol dimannoside synthase